TQSAGRARADSREGRQQADQERGPTHENDGDEERIFASHEVADPAEDDCTEGPHQQSRGIGCARRKQRRCFVPRRKEQSGEERRESRVQVEVVPLENGAERGSEDDLSLFRSNALNRFLLQQTLCSGLCHRSLLGLTTRRSDFPQNLNMLARAYTNLTGPQIFCTAKKSILALRALSAIR